MEARPDDPARRVIDESLQTQQFAAGALYVVATPIGNLADISLRALNVLARVDAVAAEDTRHTGALLDRLGVRAPLIACHEHNEREAAQQVLARLQAGERVAYVSDAGTPGISDPGARLVDAVCAAGLPVVPIPGASAVISAMSVAGFDEPSFHFAGFLSPKAQARAQAIAALKSLPASLVFYEAPHRILDTVHALAAGLGGERRLVAQRLEHLLLRLEVVVEVALATQSRTADQLIHRGLGKALGADEVSGRVEKRDWAPHLLAFMAIDLLVLREFALLGRIHSFQLEKLLRA